MSTPKDSPLTPEAAALLAEEQAAANATQPTPAGEQAATAAAITDRGPALPAESDMDAFMAAARAQLADMAAQIELLKSQQAEALRANGEPYVTRYATGAADKIGALVAAHPDAPVGHFAGVLAAVTKLAGGASAIAKGTGTLAELEQAAGDVIRFAERGHARAWNKHIDWSAIVGDVETAVDEARKIAA